VIALLATKLGDWELAEDVSHGIEVLAISVIAVGVVVAVALGVVTAFSAGAAEGVETVKRHIGRGLLLGLDLLIAADVIRTVTLEPTLENVAALGLLVVVRTFLAWSLVVELRAGGPGRARRYRTRAGAGRPSSTSWVLQRPVALIGGSAVGVRPTGGPPWVIRVPGGLAG
jgi:uncharacterized membrane protein